MDQQPVIETAQVPAVDVGAVLEALRATVRERRLAEGRAEGGPLERELQRCLDDIELHRVVSAHWPLVGHTPWEKAVALVNKLVRRGLRWYINPIIEQQNAFNDAAARALRALADAYGELREQTSAATTDGTGAPTIDGSGAADAPATQPIALDQQYAELMTLVRERAAVEPPAPFPELALQDLKPLLEQRQEVSAHWPLTGHTWPERIAAVIQKLLRRYLRWLINPLVEQQNAANAALSAAIFSLIRLDDDRRAQVAAVRARQTES
jgi:hypothetical protein